MDYSECKTFQGISQIRTTTLTWSTHNYNNFSPRNSFQKNNVNPIQNCVESCLPINIETLPQHNRFFLRIVNCLANPKIALDQTKFLWINHRHQNRGWLHLEYLHFGHKDQSIIKIFFKTLTIDPNMPSFNFTII